MNAQQPPSKPRRRIAGESKPGDPPAVLPEVEESVEETPAPTLAKPKLPKRTKAHNLVKEPEQAPEVEAEPEVEESVEGTLAPTLAKPKLPTRRKAHKLVKEPEQAAEVEAEPEIEADETDAVAGLPPAPPRAESVLVPRAKPSGKLVALLVLAIASLGFASFGAWYGVRELRADNVAASREAAADAAASAAETIFTYQYNKLDAHQRAAAKLMTPTFAKKFKSVSPALNALAPQRKIRVKAVVRNAATIECGDACSADRASVLVFIDQARVADNVDKPTVFGNRIRLSMVNRDDKWLVSEIKAL